MSKTTTTAKIRSDGTVVEIAMMLAEARRKAGLTQAELAARMKTSQAAVARIESSHGAPKWSTVERYARALGARPVCGCWMPPNKSGADRGGSACGAHEPA